MSNKYYEAEEKGIKLSDRIYYKDKAGNYSLDKLQGGWAIDEDGPWWYKVLDREDIEELGWALNKNYHVCEQEYSIIIDDYNWYGLNLSCGVDESYKYIEIEKYTIDGNLASSLTNTQTLFKGDIRNYNELKFIMQRAGIEIKETPEEVLDALEIIYMGSLSEGLYNMVQAVIDKYPTYFAEYIDGPPEKVAGGYRYKIKI